VSCLRILNCHFYGFEIKEWLPKCNFHYRFTYVQQENAVNMTSAIAMIRQYVIPSVFK
jgi:hypothetical protein